MSDAQLSFIQELRRSCLGGRFTNAVLATIVVGHAVEAPGTGLINTYGFALQEDLSWVAVASAMLGLFVSASSMAAFAESLAIDVGADGAYAILMERMPHKVRLHSALILATILAELTLCVVASVALHPVVVIPFYPLLSGLAAVMDFRPQESREWGTCVAHIAFPLLWICPGRSSIFGLHTEPSPVAWRLSVQAFRLAALPVLVWLLELPSGLVPFGELGRPMGRTVLLDMFGHKVLEIVDSALHGSDPNSWNCVTTFRSLLAVLVLLLVPIAWLGVLGRLTCCPQFRRGDNADTALMKQAQTWQKDVDDWTSMRVQKFEEVDASLLQLTAADLCSCCIQRDPYEVLPPEVPLTEGGNHTRHL